MWVFKVKKKSDETVEHHKDRLVAKGFTQELGLDYTVTFSSVVKPTTIRTMISIVVSFGWPIRQLDVQNAFLHSHITEDLYMH